MQEDINKYFKGFGGIIAGILVLCIMALPVWLMIYLLSEGIINPWVAAGGILLPWVVYGFYEVTRKH